MEQRGSWKIKTTSFVYKNHWLEVLEHQVIRPDGKDGTYSEVDILSGSSILPVDEEGNVYLVKDYRFAIAKNSLELPRGGIDENEDPLTAAKRELKEELGIEAGEWT